MPENTNKSLLFIDTETTGLNSHMHEVLSVGIVRVVDGAVMQELEYRIIPENLAQADPMALRLNKYTPLAWQDAIPKARACALLAEHLDSGELILAGHNVYFDIMFLTKLFLDQGLTFKQANTIDTWAMAGAVLKPRPSGLKSLGLVDLCQYFGIENLNPHSALADARASFEVYKKLIERK